VIVIVVGRIVTCMINGGVSTVMSTMMKTNYRTGMMWKICIFLRGNSVMQVERMNKGAAWSWLKSEIALRIGRDAADRMLAHYYELLHQEYKDRQRVSAGTELEVLRQRLEDARSAGRLPEVRRLEQMIRRREGLLAG
jgi:hypothetical protein